MEIVSGKEYRQILAQTINCLDDITKKYRVMQDDQSVPRVCHEIAKSCPHIKQVLHRGVGQTNSKPEYSTQIIPTIKTGLSAAKDLAKIFSAISPSTEVARSARYTEVVRQLGRGHKAEDLMQNLLSAVQTLARKFYDKGSSMLTSIAQALEMFTEMEESVSDDIFEGHNIWISNNGKGTQNVNTGIGTQNNNTGNAKQFIGQVMNFGRE